MSFRRFLAAFAVLASALGAAAQHERQDTHLYGSEVLEPSLLRAADLVHMDARTADGRALGRIDDALLEDDHATLSHVILLEDSGFLGFGATWRAVPWAWLGVHKSRSLEHTGDYVEVDVEPEPLADAPAAGIDRLRRLLDIEVRHESGEPLGAMQDIVIDLQRGRLAYAAISTGQFLDIGERLVTVPWNVVRIDPAREVAVVEADVETLRSHARPPGELPDLTDPQVAHALHEDFGQQPYWTVFAYGPMSLDFRRTETIRGTVVGLAATDISRIIGRPEHARPAETGTDVLLEIDTETGARVAVFAGPRSFLIERGLRYGSGERLTIEAVRTRNAVEGVVFVAKEIRDVEGQTLILFDDQGRPQWRGNGDCRLLRPDGSRTRPSAGPRGPSS